MLDCNPVGFGLLFIREANRFARNGKDLCLARLLWCAVLTLPYDLLKTNMHEQLVALERIIQQGTARSMKTVIKKVGKPNP